MKLHTDGVDAAALIERALDEQVVGAAVAVKGRAPNVRVHFVENQLVVREVPLGQAKRPLDQPGLVLERGAVIGGQRLVDDLPAVNAGGVALGQRAEALLIGPLDRVHVARHPVGGEEVVDQAVLLGGYAVRFAILQAPVDGRAAVHAGTVLVEARPAPLGLEVAPVKGHGRHVERVGEQAAVLGVLFI